MSISMPTIPRLSTLCSPAAYEYLQANKSQKSKIDLDSLAIINAYENYITSSTNPLDELVDVTTNPLIEATRKDNTEFIIFFYYRFPDLINEKITGWSNTYDVEVFKKSIMHYAAENGGSQAIETLNNINKNLINSIDLEGKTAMHYAASRGNVAGIKVIEKINPKLSKITDNYDRYPIHTAIESHNIRALKIIHKINKNLISVILKESRKTSMHIAASNNNTQAIEFIHEKNPDLINLKDIRGNTPMHCAVFSGNVEAIKALYKIKPNLINDLNNSGQTPMSCAIESKSVQLVKLLLKKGAVVNPTSLSTEEQKILEEAKKQIEQEKETFFEFLACRRALEKNDPRYDTVPQKILLQIYEEYNEID